MQKKRKKEKEKKEMQTSFPCSYKYATAKHPDTHVIIGGQLELVFLPDNKVFKQIIPLCFICNITISPRAYFIAGKFVSDDVTS